MWSLAAQVVSSWGFSITPDTLNQIASEVGEQSIISRAGGARRWLWGWLTSCTVRWVV